MHVVIAGGGVAGLEALIALRALAGDKVRITLVAPDEDFVFKPLSVGEPFALGEAKRTPVKRFARDFDAELVRDGLAEVDPAGHTITLTSGERLAYDKLVIALGARREEPFHHSTVFRGQEDSEMLHGLIQDLEGEYVRRIAFVVPGGVVWSLPVYELALMTAQRARDMGLEGLELTLVTPEERPLAVFGPEPSGQVAELLEQAGIQLHAATRAEIPAKGRLVLHPGKDELETDRVVTLAQLHGNPVPGLPADDDGFVPIDSHGRVRGVDDIYAAGDGANFPIKQGGIACQQADALAASIAAEAGAAVEPEPFRPVLRGQLITGRESHFMRSDMAGAESRTSPQTLWWPPSKIAGRYLAPYLHEAEEADQRERERRERLTTQEYELKT